jgi:hypothetical protein
MLRYKLRTLLIVLALAPPSLAGWWRTYEAWEKQVTARARVRELVSEIREVGGGRSHPLGPPNRP